MSEIKKITNQLEKALIEIEDTSLDTIVEALVGNEFRTELEIAKNKEVCKFLRKNSTEKRNLAKTNRIVCDFLRFFETETTLQRLCDLDSALSDEISAQSKESKAFDALKVEVLKMLETPLDFFEELVSLEREIASLENTLTDYISLPLIGATTDSLDFIDVDFDVIAKEDQPAPQGRLQIKKQEKKEQTVKPFKSSDNREIADTTGTDCTLTEKQLRSAQEVPDWSVDLPDELICRSDIYEITKSQILLVKKASKNKQDYDSGWYRQTARNPSRYQRKW